MRRNIELMVKSKVQSLQPQKAPGESALSATVPLVIPPEPPSLLRSIHEVDVERYADGSVRRSKNLYGYPTTFYITIRPSMPPIRTTHDGRLGFNWKTERLYLLAPERINKPFVFSNPGLEILVNPYGNDSNIREYLTKAGETGGSYAGVPICNQVKNAQQPRCCGSDDCYDLTSVGFRIFKSANNPGRNLDEAHFRSRKVVVRVRNPKTLNPEIPISYVQAQRIPADGHFVCTADFSDAMGIYRARMRAEKGLHSLRDVLLFRVPNGSASDDGQLRWNTPRANSVKNSFCLSCHTQEASCGFSLAALVPGSACEVKDPRRQPLQGPRYLGGHVSDLLLQTIDDQAAARPRVIDAETQTLYFDPLVLGSPSDGLSCY